MIVCSPKVVFSQGEEEEKEEDDEAFLSWHLMEGFCLVVSIWGSHTTRLQLGQVTGGAQAAGTTHCQSALKPCKLRTQGPLCV